MVLRWARHPRRDANHDGIKSCNREAGRGGGRRSGRKEEEGGAVLFSKQVPNRRRVGKNKKYPNKQNKIVNKNRKPKTAKKKA